MKRSLKFESLACALLLWSGACTDSPDTPGAAAEKGPGFGTIERLDPGLDELLPPDALIEKLADGFDWSEGPVWIPAAGALLFSDVPQNVVFRWKEGEGISEFLRPSGYTGTGQRDREPGSNGLALDLEDRLLLCQHGDRRLARLEPGGGFTTIVDRFDGKRFNSPNDLVVASTGVIYFTDPPYGLGGLNESPEKELPFNGVYRVDTNGELALLTSEVSFPNGIALSPDETTLYVAVSDPEKPVVLQFPLLADGTLGQGQVLFDFSALAGDMPGLPDGLKIDERGNIFTTGPGGIHVLTPQGKVLGRFLTGVATANCGWGDDGQSLYITADSTLCRVRLTTRGQVRW